MKSGHASAGSRSIGKSTSRSRGNRVEELLVSEGADDRIGLVGQVEAHRPRDPVEADKPGAQAEASGYLRRGLRGQRQE
jgi:hypothetical protein